MREYQSTQTPEERNSEAITASSAVVQGVLGYNEQWNRDKIQRRHNNIALLDGVWYRGTYYHKGIPQHKK